MAESSKKSVVLGVTGGIAAYKAAELVRELARSGIEVQVVMTEAAASLVAPATFQALSGKPVYTDLWDARVADNMAHIELSRGKDAIVVQFTTADCGPCPAKALCTKGKYRTLTVPPRDLAEAQAAARTAETTIGFQADYARRAGVEGTMHQAASHGARRARYRGLPKTRLDHVYMACALNLLRLHAYWTGTPLDRRRTSHLARLELGLAA